MLNFEDDNTNAQFLNRASAIDFVDCEGEFPRITQIHANYLQLPHTSILTVRFTRSLNGELTN